MDDGEEGKKRRDKGMHRVASKNAAWMENARLLVDKHAPRDRMFMAEEFKSYPGMGEPTHPNCWGAFTHWLVTRKLIEKTGIYVKARGPRNHAHPYPLYVRVDNVMSVVPPPPTVWNGREIRPS